MQTIDYTLILLYLAVLLALGLYRSMRKGSSAVEWIVGGRRLTLPAFVASLVSTWYGGILGVGEYSYLYGISNWLVFGLPYYLAAFLFAIFLARKARQTEALTIPDRLAAAYGKKTALAGSIVIFFMTVPTAYVLMIGVLGETLFGWPLWTGIILGTLFSVIYVYTGGFNSVVRTDIFQFVLMYLGFLLMLIILVVNFGGWEFLKGAVPQAHFTWHGGNTAWFIAIWYVIALATLIEPAFFQRCYASKTEDIPRKGIMISIACWFLFDLMTTVCGLYARALLPELDNPVGAYPALALKVLPPGLLGLFVLSMLAIVMSTVDSYAFIAASTFSRDIAMRVFTIDESRIAWWTRMGLIVTALLAVVPLLVFRSVVDIWHLFGSIGTPALLVPVFFSFVGKRRLTPPSAVASIVLSGGVSLVWYLSKQISVDGSYWWGIEPIFPGLLLSLAIFAVFSRRSRDLEVANVRN